MKKILLTDKLYRVIDFHAKKAGLTADELVEVLIKREYRIRDTIVQVESILSENGWTSSQI